VAVAYLGFYADEGGGRREMARKFNLEKIWKA